VIGTLLVDGWAVTFGTARTDDPEWPKTAVRQHLTLGLCSFYGACCEKRMKIEHHMYYQQQRIVPGLWILVMYKSVRSQGHNILERQISRKWYKIELMVDWMKVVGLYAVSNGVIFNDLERLLTHVWSACHYSTFSVPER